MAAPVVDQTSNNWRLASSGYPSTFSGNASTCTSTGNMLHVSTMNVVRVDDEPLSSCFQVFCWGQMRLWLNWRNHFGRDSLVIGRRRRESKNKWRRTGYSAADIKSMTWQTTPDEIERRRSGYYLPANERPGRADCSAAAYSAVRNRQTFSEIFRLFLWANIEGAPTNLRVDLFLKRRCASPFFPAAE